MIEVDFERQFEFENGFYATAPVHRISKFVAHLDLFRRSSGLPGEIVECGVFKGNSLFRWIKLRSLLENPFSRRVIAFDVFGEFPDGDYEPDRILRERFIAEAGSRGIGVERMREVLAHHDLDVNVELVPGDILRTVPDYLQRVPQLKISLLHIDVDLYEPTRVALEVLFPRVVAGGIVVLDDYGAFPGANRAIDDYLRDRPERVQKLPFANAISFIERRG